MKLKLALAAAAAIACTFTTPAAAQQAGRAIVQIYHVAPGQHVAFLKWLDQQDRVAAAAEWQRVSCMPTQTVTAGIIS